MKQEFSLSVKELLVPAAAVLALIIGSAYTADLIGDLAGSTILGRILFVPLGLAGIAVLIALLPPVRKIWNLIVEAGPEGMANNAMSSGLVGLLFTLAGLLVSRQWAMALVAVPAFTLQALLYKPSRLIWKAPLGFILNSSLFGLAVPTLDSSLRIFLGIGAVEWLIVFVWCFRAPEMRWPDLAGRKQHENNS